MPRSSSSLLILSLVLSTALLSLPAAAEVSVRECIDGDIGGPTAYVIPAHTTVTLLTMGFALNSSSNGIFNAQIFFPDATGQTLGDTSRFDLLVDGSNAGRLSTPIQYYTRTPWVTQGVVNVRAFYSGLTATSGTDHTLTLVVNNTSANTYAVTGAYANALFVESANMNTGMYDPSTHTVSGGTYQTIDSITIPSGLANGDMFWVSSYLRASSPNTMKFRYIVNGVVTEKKLVNFNGADNGTTVDWLVVPPSSSQSIAGQTVTLQALIGSGSGSVIEVEMAGQAMPWYATVNTLQDGVIQSSNSTNLVPITWGSTGQAPPATQVTLAAYPNSLTGPPGSGSSPAGCMWGTADTSVSISPANAEVQLRLWMPYGTTNPPPNTPYGGGDFGAAGVSPDATYSSYHQPTDFGCGGPLYEDDYFTLQQRIVNNCTTGTVPTWTTTHQRLQLVMVPAPCDATKLNCTVPWPGTLCELDNQTCTASTRAGWKGSSNPACCSNFDYVNNKCITVLPCPHQCTFNRSFPTVATAGGTCS